MSPPHLPIEALPAWALLNAISFTDVKVQEIPGKGFGLVYTKDQSTGSDAASATPTLITIPHSLVLNVEAVEEYAKEDKNFKQLLDVAGHRTPRGTIVLFLLVQTALASRTTEPAATERRHSSSVGVSNPWTEYIKFLPKQVDLLVPTLWTEDERLLLRGTSLESAINAKMSALVSEFDKVREVSSSILAWNEALWEHETVHFQDWIFLDAIYRSRCLELPRSGESMVPCLDMVNHTATNPSAYYDENPRGDKVALLLRPGAHLSAGDEVTISYGDAKSAAEMLFSYGFIDPTTTTSSLVLPLEPFPDDPLAKAKLVAFGEAPKVHVEVAQDKGSGAGGSSDDPGVTCTWKSPFAYLMCVNEEDGLEFRVLQDNQGNQQLRVFWLDEDVTDRTGEFETLIRSHQSLAEILRLRAVSVIQECLRTQLGKLASNSGLDSMTAEDFPLVREGCFTSAMLLRDIEKKILECGIEELEEERCVLLADEKVVACLGSMETSKSDVADEELTNEAEADDFS